MLARHTIVAARDITPKDVQVRARRKYRRSDRPRAPRTWRTHKDAFEAVREEVCRWLAAEPERTAKSVFLDLQQQHPGRYPDGQLPTLPRRVKEWRARAIPEFDACRLDQEPLAGVGQTMRPRGSLAA